MDQPVTPLKTLFDRIADAIRTMDETEGEIPAETFPERILGIPKGDGLLILKSLAIAEPPAKTSYYFNGLFHEFFDPTGMIFTLTVELLGASLAMPITPDYEAIDEDRYKMSYDVAPTPPEGMSGFPSDFKLSMTPDREVQDGDSAITATVSWHGQTVTVQQPVTVAYEQPHWYDIEKQDRTWDEFEEEFDTWAGVESA